MVIELKYQGENTFPMATHPGLYLSEHLDSIPVHVLQNVLGCSDEYFNQLVVLQNPHYSLSRTMCVRLAHFFESSYEFWFNMQEQYDNANIVGKESLLVQDLYPQR